MQPAGIGGIGLFAGQSAGTPAGRAVVGVAAAVVGGTVGGAVAGTVTGAGALLDGGTTAGAVEFVTELGGLLAGLVTVGPLPDGVVTVGVTGCCPKAPDCRLPAGVTTLVMAIGPVGESMTIGADGVAVEPTGTDTAGASEGDGLVSATTLAAAPDGRCTAPSPSIDIPPSVANANVPVRAVAAMAMAVNVAWRRSIPILPCS